MKIVVGDQTQKEQYELTTRKGMEIAESPLPFSRCFSETTSLTLFCLKHVHFLGRWEEAVSQRSSCTLANQHFLAGLSPTVGKMPLSLIQLFPQPILTFISKLKLVKPPSFLCAILKIKQATDAWSTSISVQ